VFQPISGERKLHVLTCHINSEANLPFCRWDGTQHPTRDAACKRPRRAYMGLRGAAWVRCAVLSLALASAPSGLVRGARPVSVENDGAENDADTDSGRHRRLASADADNQRLIGWLGEVERPPAGPGALSGASSSVGLSAGAAESAQDGTPRRRQWIEQVTTSPRAYVWHGFMSDDECDHIVRTAEPLMEKSGVIDAQSGKETFDPIRTSFGAFLPIAYDAVVARVEQRAAEWQGLRLLHLSAQLEPCLTQENTLHTLNTP